MSSYKKLNVPVVIRLTLISETREDGTVVPQRHWYVMTNNLGNWYRKGDDSCTLVNTHDGKTFSVVEDPIAIEEML